MARRGYTKNNPALICYDNDLFVWILRFIDKFLDVST